MIQVNRNTANSRLTYRLGDKRIGYSEANVIANERKWGSLLTGPNADRGRYLLSLLIRRPTDNVGLRVVRETPKNRFTVRFGSNFVERFNKVTGHTSRIPVGAGDKYGQGIAAMTVMHGRVYEG